MTLLPLLWLATTATTDYKAVQSSEDSSVFDSGTVHRLPTTTVVGIRRLRMESVDSSDWTTHAGLGQSGPLESLRDRPGISSQGEFSGQFSSTGMPYEGGAVTWDGADIPWPWHFGGLFGVLDAAAVGKASWDPTGGGASLAGGGGWLETGSKATTSRSEGFHGSLEAGTIDGSAAVWGTRGDWSVQACYRRTWLDPALELAHHEGWSSEELVIQFWDATAAVAWSRGPWSAHVGIFASADSLSVGATDSLDGLLSSWRNTVVPASLEWSEDGWGVGADLSLSDYTRYDDELSASDTLDLHSFSVHTRQDISETSRLETGLRFRMWNTSYAEADHPVSGFPGDSHRNLLEPWISVLVKPDPWNAKVWLGLAHDERDPSAPQGGVRLGWGEGYWSLQTDLERKIVPVSVLGSITDGTEMPSPVWFFPTGASPRTTALHVSALRSETGTQGSPSTEFRALGWLRSTEGLWAWEGVWNLGPPENLVRTSYREDAGSAGLDLSGRILFDRLELGGRQTVSLDVVQRRPQDGTTFPVQWAPWDQRLQTEFDAAWAWKGSVRAIAGKFFLRSRLVLHNNSGTLRPDVAGWTLPSPGLDLDTLATGTKEVAGQRRAPYFRMDLTPVEFGREGSWTAFWSIVDLTDQRNPLAWVSNAPNVAPQEIDQIPFLPVVFGVRLLF
ncbi:MAG TPA: hypothetical protein VN931_01845 [Fibrobacteria bacterium]|nr:hypothetical protein [Fibrobacteria bacterium]